MSVLSNGTASLTVGDKYVVNGYLIERLEPGSRTRDRQVVTSPFVDDEFEVNSRLNGLRLALDFYLERDPGGDWDDLKAMREALLDIVESVTWTLVVEGVTYDCWAADSSSPTPADGTNSKHRLVNLDVPVRQQRGL